jgi:cytoskeletal protein RodZ
VGAFGEKLRQQREQRGLALDAISNTTKISTRMLRALEDEHFDQLPGGVFNKGFVRAYARQVGLNEEEAVADYLAALRESQIQQQSILPDFRAPAGKQKTVGAPVVPSNGRPPIDTPQQEDRRKTNEDRRNQDRRNEARRIEAHRIEAHRHRPTDPPTSPDSATDLSANFLPEPFADTQAAETPGQPAHEPSAPIPWGKLAAALLLVTAILAIWNFRRHSQPRAASLPAASRPQQSSAPAPAPVSTPAATSQTASANPLTVGKSSLPGPLASGTLSPGTISSGASSTKPEPTLPGVPPALNQATPAAATANPPLAKKVPAPSPQPPATFTVLIRAEKTTWVSIVADGKPVAEENLIAPAQTSVRASHEIYVRAGNAAGVSFQLNGKEFPAQGNEGEVKTYIFDSTSMHVDPQPQTPTTNR